MKKYLAEYQAQNPEKFNQELFNLREKEDVLQAVRECFKSLEIIDEIKLVSVELDTDESQFDPIIKQKSKDGGKEFFKPILPSRLDRIRYKFVITPTEDLKMKPILSDDEEGNSVEKDYSVTEHSYYREGILYLNKLVDHWFYINEGSRYYLIYQIVDNATYGTGNAVSLKSLLMPITIQKKPENGIVISSVSSSNSYTVPSYSLNLFAKHINVLLYYMAKYSFNDLVRMKIENPENIVEERNNKRCPAIIEKINKFFDINLEFDDDMSKLMREGREVFRTPGDGVYISVDKEKLEAGDKNLLAILGCFFDVKVNGKQKKKTEYKYDDLTRPMFWVDVLASYFTTNNDPIRKFDKIKTMLVSLDRLTDESTKRILRLPEEDKKNSLAVIRYMLRNFDYLNNKDPNNFDDKRIRIIESMLYPLRSYFSTQTYRVLNAPTRSRQVLDRIFSNLTPTFLLKSTVTSELLRYYNAANELNSIAAVLKVTQSGPQSLGKTVSNATRDVQPSQVGRLSLINASASNPGISSMLSPFCELEEGMFFSEEKENQS